MKELKGEMKQMEKNIGEKLDILLADKYFRDGVEHGKQASRGTHMEKQGKL